MLWENIRFFKPEEFGHNVEKMDIVAIYTLDDMRFIEAEKRRIEGKEPIIITINEAWAERPSNPTSMHPQGKAIDCVIRNAKTKKPLPIIEQFLIAIHYSWTGIGFYPFWKDPGLHLDIRPPYRLFRKTTWWRNKHGGYEPIETYFL